MKEDLERYKRLLEGWKGDPPPTNPAASRAGTAEARPSAGRPSGESGPPPGDRSRPAGRPAHPDAAGSAPLGGLAGGDQKAKLRRPTPAAALPKHPAGTILVLDEEELTVYSQAVPGSNQDLLFALLSDGSAKPEGYVLDGRDVRVLGRLDDGAFRVMQSRKRWSRRMIADACESPEDAEMIPEPEGEPDTTTTSTGTRPAPAPEPPPRREARSEPSPPRPEPRPEPRADTRPAAEPRVYDHRPRAERDRPERPKLRRGVPISLMFGGKKWDAVYWGRDARGTVIAHRTHRTWEIMHLDLEQYKDSMVVADDVDEEKLDEIMRFLDTMIAE